MPPLPVLVPLLLLGSPALCFALSASARFIVANQSNRRNASY